MARETDNCSYRCMSADHDMRPSRVYLQKMQIRQGSIAARSAAVEFFGQSPAVERGQTESKGSSL